MIASPPASTPEIELICCNITSLSTSSQNVKHLQLNYIPFVFQTRSLTNMVQEGKYNAQTSKHTVFTDIPYTAPGAVYNFTLSKSYTASDSKIARLARYEIDDSKIVHSFKNITNGFRYNVLSEKDIYYNESSAITTSDYNESFRGNLSSPYNLPRLSVEIQIALYAIIFVLSLVGNLLIIVTLIQNKRMRTVTNVFLLNLAVSDMLLALVCMPFTLVPVLLMNFIFGKFMCVFIRYLQAVTVAVSCFTLVAISLERYFAICRPLHSRSWQTLSHAYRCIAVCWVLAAALMTPTAVFQKHIAIGKGAHMCREIWPNLLVEQAYTVLLDITMLVLPVFIMSIAYSRVVHTLVFDVRSSMDLGVASNGNNFVLKNYRTIELRLLSKDSCRSVASITSTDTTFSESITPPKNISRSGTITTPPLARKSKRSVGNRMRHSNPARVRQNKMRVIRMLFVVVLEFFFFWTPVYVLQTWMAFHEESAYQAFTPLTKTLFHLLSYGSSFCNPITYCFMNKKFREAFLRVFQCRPPPQSIRERRVQQMNQKRLDFQREQKRRSTAVSRLSERFNPLASTTSIVFNQDSVIVREPALEKCMKLNRGLNETDIGSSSE